MESNTCLECFRLIWVARVYFEIAANKLAELMRQLQYSAIHNHMNKNY